jgi:hypothetical protein
MNTPTTLEDTFATLPEPLIETFQNLGSRREPFCWRGLPDAVTVSMPLHMGTVVREHNYATYIKEWFDKINKNHPVMPSRWPASVPKPQYQCAICATDPYVTLDVAAVKMGKIELEDHLCAVHTISAAFIWPFCLCNDLKDMPTATWKTKEGRSVKSRPIRAPTHYRGNLRYTSTPLDIQPQKLYHTDYIQIDKAATKIN